MTGNAWPLARRDELGTGEGGSGGTSTVTPGSSTSFPIPASSDAAETVDGAFELAGGDAGATVDEEAVAVGAEVLLADHAQADGAELEVGVVRRLVGEVLVVELAVEAFDGEVAVEPVAGAQRIAGVVVAVAAQAGDVELRMAAADFTAHEPVAVRSRGRTRQAGEEEAGGEDQG